MEKLEKAALCFLHSINGLGNRRLWKIKVGCGSFLGFLMADPGQLYASDFPAELVNEIIARRKNTDLLNYLNKLEQKGIRLLCIEDSDYPEMLKNIPNPPYILYLKGELNINAQCRIAVVGSRKATVYGKKTAFRIGKELAVHGMEVVSGMARGIDTQAHLGALDAGGGTIAVLGSGLNNIYPRENYKLYERICESGLVMSEFSLDTRPEPGNFPNRNRLISGLCRGVVVVEAKVKSGALITADFALEQGRDVFAVPGPIDSEYSEGTNNLIKQGAQLITGADDILQEYNYTNKIPFGGVKQEELHFLDANESLVVAYLNHQPFHFDEIFSATGLDIGELGTLLLKLELAGIVKSLPGNYYVKIN
ncbi:MAG: DNA-processing protein DprA [Syntrophomonas sp.]